MEYLALFVIAILSHTGSSRSLRGYDHNDPAGNHHNFNYNSWCHSAGGWDHDKDSWEDSSSEESQWDDKDRLIRSTTTRRSVVITKTQSQGTSTISFREASTGSTPSPFEVLLCLRMCPITQEYNPVCGTDDITYWNPGRLQCAISCGVNVGLKRQSICPTTNLDTTSTSSVSTTPSPQAVATCMRSCPVTSEYNPICGTDDLTYNNPSRLECAKSCGKPVSLRLPSRCPSPDEVTSSTSQAPATTSSPTSTTPSTTTSITSTTSTSARTPVNPNTTSNPVSNDSRNTTVYTVAPDILDAIFNGNSISTTTEYIPDFSFDERFEDFKSIDEIV